MRLLLATLGCVLSLMASSGHADCDNSDLLIFGNSLSDTGAGFILSPTVTTPPGGQAIPPSPPYFNGRYSDGPNWVDYVQNNLDVDVQNFAVGGAESGFFNNFDPIYPMGGFLTQIGRYATLQTPIPEHTTTIVEIGANDFLNLLDSLPVPPTPAQLTLTILGTIQNVIGGVQALQALGAERTVVWNLPPLYATPLFNNPFFGPINLLKPFFEAASANYNPLLLEQIKSINLTAPGHKTAFYLDIESIITDVGADLIAQGIDLAEFNIYSQFLNPAVIIPVQPYNPDTAFFDQVHPSTLAWSLIGKEISAYLSTIDTAHRSISAQTDLTFENYRAYRSLIDNHFRTLHRQFYVCPQDCNDCCNPLQYQVYVDGLAKWGRTRDGCSTYGQRYDTQLVSLGLDYFLNNCLTAGVSFTAQRNNSRLNDNHGSLLLNEYIPTLYATYTDPCFFVDWDISYRYLYFKKIQRNVDFICRNQHGHATGWGIGSALQGGYLYTCDCVTMGPIIGLEYESALIHHYNEKGTRYPSLKVRGQHQDSLLGKIGWQLFWNKCDCGFSPYADVNYYYDFFNCRRVVISRFRHVYDRSQIRHKIHSNRERNILTYDLGVDFNVWDCVTGNLSYEGETTFKHYNNSIIAELNAPF